MKPEDVVRMARHLTDITEIGNARTMVEDVRTMARYIVATADKTERAVNATRAFDIAVADLHGKYRLNIDRIVAAYGEEIVNVPNLLARALAMKQTDLWVVAAILYGKPGPDPGEGPG